MLGLSFPYEIEKFVGFYNCLKARLIENVLPLISALTLKYNNTSELTSFFRKSGQIYQFVYTFDKGAVPVCI